MTIFLGIRAKDLVRFLFVENVSRNLKEKIWIHETSHFNLGRFSKYITTFPPWRVVNPIPAGEGGGQVDPPLVVFFT